MHRAAAPLSVLLALLLAACADARPPLAPAPATLHDARVASVPVHVRLARTPAERRQGLMAVEHLDPDEGMLFVYETAGARTIWMRGCSIALDVAFLDGEGRVLEVATLRPPTETDGHVEQRTSAADARYVLELPAGFFARHGLGPGARVTLPAVVRRR